jgi:hypothetical protein
VYALYSHLHGSAWELPDQETGFVLLIAPKRVSILSGEIQEGGVIILSWLKIGHRPIDLKSRN